MTDSPKRKQGFACLSLERRREIAAMGGKAVPAEKRAYSRDPVLARAAGLKGGMAPHSTRGAQVPADLQEVWTGRRIAKIKRLAAAGKSLVEVREEVGSELNIPAFRWKCRGLGVTFVRTRPA